MSVCGIDEVGRGPLAGPVTAAAVVLIDGFETDLLDDSKAMSAEDRESVFAMIVGMNVPYGVGWVWPEEIDRLNIHRATLLAMKRAFTELIRYDDLIETALVDGKFAPELGINTRAVVGGDGIHREIMAASIVAKVLRDRWMIRYSWIEPGYGYDRHKGYATRYHRARCIELGDSPIQRRSFRVRLDRSIDG